MRVLRWVVPSAPSGNVRFVQGNAPLPVAGCAAIRVRPPGDLGYWSVRDGAYELVPGRGRVSAVPALRPWTGVGDDGEVCGELGGVLRLVRDARLGLGDAAARFDEFVLLLRNELVSAAGPRCWSDARALGGSITSWCRCGRCTSRRWRTALVGEETIAALFVMGEVPDLGVSERRGRGGSRCVRVMCCGRSSRVTWCR